MRKNWIWKPFFIFPSSFLFASGIFTPKIQGVVFFLGAAPPPVRCSPPSPGRSFMWSLRSSGDLCWEQQRRWRCEGAALQCKLLEDGVKMGKKDHGLWWSASHIFIDIVLLQWFLECWVMPGAGGEVRSQRVFASLLPDLPPLSSPFHLLDWFFFLFFAATVLAPFSFL